MESKTCEPHRRRSGRRGGKETNVEKKRKIEATTDFRRLRRRFLGSRRRGRLYRRRRFLPFIQRCSQSRFLLTLPRS